VSSKTWLDRVAPVRAGATRGNAWAVIGLAVFVLAMSAWGFTRPFGELTNRMHLPVGLLSVLLLFFSAWLVLLAVNVFRHNR